MSWSKEKKESKLPLLIMILLIFIRILTSVAELFSTKVEILILCYILTVLPCGHLSTSDWHLYNAQCKLLAMYFENQCQKNDHTDVGILIPCGSKKYLEKVLSNLQKTNLTVRSFDIICMFHFYFFYYVNLLNLIWFWMACM